MLTLLAAAALSLSPASTELQRAAEVLSAHESRSRGVGAWVPDVALVDLNGDGASWRSAAGPKGTVIALVSATCPVGQKLFPRIAELEQVADRLGFGVVHVGIEGLDDPDTLAAHGRAHGLTGPILQDSTGTLARALDARTTTEVFLLDATGTLRYRGAVNDQYGIGFALPRAREHYLRDAMAALAANREVPVAATHAPGCLVEPTAGREAASHMDDAEVTYSRQISRLMQRSCVECHREGGVAPFALESYESVSRRASMLLGVIDEGLMPPWFAAHTEDGASPWANDRSLLPGERDLLERWIEAGKPQGDASDLPQPRRFAERGWALGEPDAIYRMPRAFDVPADGRVDYQYFAVPTGLERDAWISAIEVQPGSMDVVHHVLAYALPQEAFKGGRLVRWDLLDERRGFFAAWAPGAEPVSYPPDHARLLRAGTVLMLELHYTPNGTPRRDRSRIGVHFASTDPDFRPEHIVRTAGISNRSFRVPAGASDHVDSAVGVATRTMRVASFMPHMHLRGKSFRFDHVDGEGSRRSVLDVPRYDFNWQLSYDLETPLLVRAGERIDVRAVFDNSPENFANPAPNRAVGWGPDTDDEMLIGFVDYVLEEEDPTVAPDEPQFVVLEPRIQAFLRRIAGENGGRVPRGKIPRDSRPSFDKLDQDRNGELDAAELPILSDKD